MKKQLLTLIIAIYSLNGMAQTVPVYVDTNNLTAWYSFDGNAVDSSGNGNNGTVSGAILTSDRFGHSNNAYHFNGFSDYISSPASFTNLDTAKSFSVWFKMDSLKRGWIIAGGNDISGQAFGLFVQTNGLGDIIFQGMGSYDVVLDTLADTTIWHHAVVTFASDTIRAYIDGVLKVTSPDYLTTASAGITIGRRQNPALEIGNDAYFKGKIDDIGIWSKALDTCHISQLYSASPHSCGTSLNVPKEEISNVSVSPNPVYNELNIQNSSVIEKIEITNMVGQTMYIEKSHTTNLQLQLNHFKPGIYILRINDIVAQRIIKE